MSKKKSKEELGKFRSHFEMTVAEKMPDNSCYECEEVEYKIPEEPHKYTPDFVITAKDGHKVYLEVKGRFRTKAEADKYIHIRNSNQNMDLRFIIMDAKTLMPRSKKTTMKQWLEKNGFTVYVWPNIPNLKKL